MTISRYISGPLYRYGIEILQQSLSAHRHLSEWRVRESASLYNPTNFDAIFLRNGGDNQHKNLRGIWHRWDEYVIQRIFIHSQPFRRCTALKLVGLHSKTLFLNRHYVRRQRPDCVTCSISIKSILMYLHIIYILYV